MWATLQTQFFLDHPPGRDFFDRHLGAFPWNEEVLPVYEWENQVFVAAVNPEAISAMMSEWPAHWILVQAEAPALKHLWHSWNDSENSAAESNPFDSEPRSMSFKDEATQPRIPFEMNEDTSPPVQMPTLPSDVEVRTPAATAKVAAAFVAPTLKSTKDFNPEDFFSSVEEQSVAPMKTQASASGELDLSGGFPDVAESSEDESPDSSSEEASPEMDESPSGLEGLDLPEGLGEVSSGTNSSASITNSRPNVPLPNFKTPTPLTAPPAPLTAPPAPASLARTDIPVPASNPSIAKMDPPPAAADRAPNRAIPTNGHSAVNPAPLPKAPPTKAPPGAPTGPEQPAVEKVAAKPSEKPLPKPPPTVAAVTADEKAPKENTATFHGLKVSDETRRTLETVPEMYSKALLATKAGNSIRIVAWPASHTKIAEQETDFSLGTPSPFRIVLRTEKPYHGYVINSPYLDGFFQSWNGGHYPEVLTIVPIHSGGATLGFVIAFGSGPAIGKAGLNAIDQLSQDLLRNWPQNPASKAG